MKKITLILASIFAIAIQSMAYGYGRGNINSYADAFVFDEMGVTFSVYPDGEFDFYLAGAHQSATIGNGYVSATFNSGYNYNPYVQYDDFGAVIQVENVPVWYDYYGRVTQIGDVMINYRNRMVCQVGGMYVHYNRHGHYAYHTGFINTWNPYFVYRPFYVAFTRPVINMCFVRTTPYRQYYTPVRYTYYRPYVRNTRPCYATIGHTYRPRGGNGVAHASYRQSAGRGEVAFKRERRTVTTASSRPASVSTINGRALNSNVNRGSSARTVNNSSRSVKPATSNRQVISSNPRQIQTAPSRTRNSASVNARSVQPRTSTNSSSNRAVQSTTTSRMQSAVKPSVSRTSSRTTSPSRTQAVSKPTVQRSSSNQSGGRTISKPQSTPRSSTSITRSSNLNSRSMSKTPSRSSSSSSRTISKGSAGNTISKRGK